MTSSTSTATAKEVVVLDVGRQFRASETAVVESSLLDRRGVLSVDANPVAQTATVGYDPTITSVSELRRVIERCDFECAGRNVPGRLCDPAGTSPDRPRTSYSLIPKGLE